MDIPLFIILFFGILLGLVAGGVLTWLGQGKWRRETRVRRRENRDLVRDVEKLQNQPPQESGSNAIVSNDPAIAPR